MEASKTSANLLQVKKGEITHSFSEEEKEAFTDYVRFFSCFPSSRYHLGNQHCVTVDQCCPGQGLLAVASIMLCTHKQKTQDRDIGHRLPINAQDMSLFSSVKDGLLLCKLINDAIPDTIDERVLNKGDNLNVYKMTENQQVAINSAKAIGCNVINIGGQDLIDGTPHLVLGLIWQIVKIGLFSKINLVNHPEL